MNTTLIKVYTLLPRRFLPLTITTGLWTILRSDSTYFTFSFHLARLHLYRDQQRINNCGQHVYNDLHRRSPLNSTLLAYKINFSTRRTVTKFLAIPFNKYFIVEPKNN